MRDGDDDGFEPSALELGELETRALAAWLEDGAEVLDIDADDRELPLPGGVLPGFAERVLAAESTLVPVPVIVDVEDDPPALTPARAPSRWSVRLGAVALAAGLGGAWWLGATSGHPPASPEGDTATGVAGELADEPPQEIAAPPPVPMPADLDLQIADYIRDYGRHFGPTFEFHGAILIARDGKVEYRHGFGSADPAHARPNTPATQFRLGMLTEQFTAAAILQLRDGGMLELDDTVAEHLPNFPNGRRITIENLLDHTSGLPNYTDLPNFHRWKALPHRTEEMLGRFSELPLEFAPGTDFNPTNSGYFVLGAIIERVSGLGYGEYMQRFVFEPAGMTASAFGDHYDGGNQALGNVWNVEEQLEPPDPIDMSVFGGAGGLVSTVEDFARWDAALYGGEVLSRSSAEQMLDPNRFGYGFGWLVGEAYGQRVVSFPGAIDGFNAAVMRFTGDRTLVVVLANTEVVPAGRIAEDIAMMVYGERPSPRIEYPEVQVAPGTFSRYVGTFGITDETVRVLGDGADDAQLEPLQTVYVKQIGDRLYLDIPGHGSTWMHPMGRHRFFFKDNSGNFLTFTTRERDAGGPATALVVNFGEAELELQRKDEEPSVAVER